MQICWEEKIPVRISKEPECERSDVWEVDEKRRIVEYEGNVSEFTVFNKFLGMLVEGQDLVVEMINEKRSRILKQNKRGRSKNRQLSSKFGREQKRLT